MASNAPTRATDNASESFPNRNLKIDEGESHVETFHYLHLPQEMEGQFTLYRFLGICLHGDLEATRLIHLVHHIKHMGKIFYSEEMQFGLKGILSMTVH